MTKNEEPVRVRFQCCTRLLPFDPAFDDEGFLVCPEHGERRYGWRSPLVTGTRPDFSKSRLEQDQAFVREIFDEHGT
jgi:hypothetical protein